MAKLFVNRNSSPADKVRITLLVVGIFTAINIITYYFDLPFPFAAYAPFWLNVFGHTTYLATGNVASMVLFIALAVLLTAPYFVCFFLSRHNIWWVMGCFVYFCADAVWLLIDFGIAFMTDDLSLVSDVVCSVVIVVYCLYGLIPALKKAKNNDGQN